MKELGSPPVHENVLQRLASAPCVFFFLDYDGTLAPIAPRPELAQPAPEATATVESLAALPRVHVAVVSGRRVQDLRALFPVTGAHYIGAHGAELCTPEGACRLSVDSEQFVPLLARVRQCLENEFQPLPGVWIEDKGISLACHFRLASPQDRARVQSIVQRVHGTLHAAGAPLEILEGHCVIEFRPRGVNKGTAVLNLLQAYNPECLPVYAGDDRTDEDAFRALAGRGITIRVGPCNEPTAAEYILPDPTALVAFLKEAQRALLQRG
ncbi:MAG: trehalose 6-phosphate phosphatase [Candidatus Binatia bacterium]|nr:MAG: trehalose 6-phosphate phosphatase [Candidatus Binatia bacterium]